MLRFAHLSIKPAISRTKALFYDSLCPCSADTTLPSGSKTQFNTNRAAFLIRAGHSTQHRWSKTIFVTCDKCDVFRSGHQPFCHAVRLYCTCFGKWTGNDQEITRTSGTASSCKTTLSQFFCYNVTGRSSAVRICCVQAKPGNLAILRCSKQTRQNRNSATFVISFFRGPFHKATHPAREGWKFSDPLLGWKLSSTRWYNGVLTLLRRLS